MPQVLPLIFAGVGAAAAVAGVVQSNKAVKQAQQTAAEQKTQAKNAASLETVAASTDANVQLGTDDPTAKRRTGAATKTANSAKVTSGMTTGGISASSVGGL